MNGPSDRNLVPAASGSRQSAGADGVLEEFSQLRADVLGLLTHGERAGAVLGQNAAQIAPLFAAARQAVDLGRLNLTVIGAEGVGKSTLINAIAGADLTPRERDHPGTVAPTYAEAGESRTPVFQVVLRGDDGRETIHSCAGIEEFRTYLLQHENRDNQRGVVRGLVRYDHPLLRRGLRLVDMPGVHASSPLVNQEARRFLAAETHAVVAVTYGRTGYGALHEVFDDLAVRREHVHAVVINQELGYFATHDLALLPEEELRTKLAETRAAAAQELGIPEERIFLINLASWYEARVHAGAMLQSPAHEEEVSRFQRHLWAFMRENGVAEVIDRAADDATTALHALYVRLELAGRALGAIAGGDKQEGKRIAAAFKAARRHAAESWRRVSGDDVAASVAAQHWPPLKHAADHARDEIASALDAALTELNEKGGHVSGRDAALWKQRLQTRVMEERDALDRAYGESLRATLDYYTAHADAALTGVYEQVPLLAESAQGDRLMVGSGGLMLTQMGAMEPGMVEQLAKWGMAGGTGLLAGNLAGGGGTALLVTALGMNPFTALALGGMVGSSAALLLWRFVRDEHRDALVGGLTRYRGNALAALDTSPGSSLRKEWEGAVRSVSARVGESLELQLTGVEGLLSSPSGESGAALAARRSAISGAIDTVDALRAELDRIRAQAESLTPAPRGVAA